LFAALNVLDGTVIGRNMQRHRHQEFIQKSILLPDERDCHESASNKVEYRLQHVPSI
jgi:hypothetical protein